MISDITRNIFIRVVFVQLALSLASFAHSQELPAAVNTSQILVGTSGNGRLRTPGGDVVFRDEDILKYDLRQQTWSVYFDGSDVGIFGDVNAFSMLSDGSMLLSLDAPAQIADLGLIDDSDILHFQPDSATGVQPDSTTGVDTSGTLSIYFDGSDVGLTTASEDIHALSVLDNGNLLISTNGNNSVPGVNAADEDLLEFSPTTLGAETAGTWSLYFDGSDVELTQASEDIWALSAVGSGLHLSTRGSFSVSDIQGSRADVLSCSALQLGQTTHCEYSVFARGQNIGFGTKRIDSMDILIGSDSTDTTEPTGVATIAPAANEFDWHNSNVTVNFSWSDAGGIDFDNCTTQTAITVEGAAVSYSAFCSDLAGNVSEITGSVAIDKQQPETNITSLPTVVDGGVDIAFEGVDSLSGIDRFECNLNGGDFIPCISPQQYESLDNGNYSVEVRSIDKAGNIDQTPESQSWVVDSSDLTAPIASPVFAPTANTLDWHSTDVVVTFNWTDNDGLDANSCTASTVVIGEGESLQYTGTCDDINGNTGTSTGTVSIDRTAPVTTIFASPAAVTDSTTATFEFSGTDGLSGIAGYECQLDGNGYTPCTSPTSYPNLPSFAHVFEVRAIDIADNRHALPARYSWTIAGPNSSYLEPVTQLNPPAVGTQFSYAQIAANALPEFLLETDGEYLAELLRQNPKVRWWSQDKAMRMITITSEPETTGMVLNIQPSGGDDTAMIQNAAATVGEGGVVQGNGEVFKVNQLLLTEPGVTFRDMPMQPSVQEGFYSVRVNAADVTFIRSPLDQLGRMISHGFIIWDGAHRFTMVDGGVANSINTIPKPGALMRITEDVDDIYIVGNEFKNSFASGEGNSVRGIWWSGPDVGKTPRRGVIANNLFENLQSSEKGNDADALVVQGLDNNNRFEENLLFIANVGINAGKRLIKAQSGGIDAHGNFNWWRDAIGPEGVRVTRAHYDNHGPSNCRWTNNIARTDHSNRDSESYFMAMQTHRWEKELQSHDIVFRNNIYEHNATTDGNRTSYGFFIFDFVGDQTVSWPVDSSISDNVIRGSGELRYLYWFRNGVTKEVGPDPTGSQFEHSGNVLEIPVVKSIHRQN